MNKMKYANLGLSGAKVSRLCLGTMNLGDQTDEKESNKILDFALQADINFIDTADVYGKPWGHGKTELLIGRWLAKNKSNRKKIILATKVYGKIGEGVNQSGLSAVHIKEACEASLRRLKTDHIDLYQMHHVDRRTPWPEIWQAMEQLIREGKILYVGSSNFAGWHIATANEEAKRRNLIGLVSEQSRYNLTLRAIEREVIPACQHYGVGILPWSPLGGGFLAGISNENLKTGRRSRKGMQEWLKRSQTQINQWENFCKVINKDKAAVALSWLLHQPAVTSVIIGPRTLKQLQGLLTSLEINLSQSSLNELDTIFPPAGIAPEYYAW